MLIAALGLTLLGFAFLIVAVATGQVAWAWACIVVGGLGLLVLIVDLLTGKRKDDGDPADPADSADSTDRAGTDDTAGGDRAESRSGRDSD